jgi:3'(2'), 5'-bisphosphate nucleotidase
MVYRSLVDTESDRDLAVRLAQAAGRLLLEIRQEAGPIAPEDKPALKALRDKADAAAHILITDALVAARPDDAVLSEEGKDDSARLGFRRVWIVDPLDGTWEYGQGRSDFGVHIALYDTQTGQVLVGVVDLPEHGLTRTSQDQANLSPLPSDRPIRIVASRTRPPKDLGQIANRLADRVGHEVEVVNVGSVGAKVNVILQGDAEAYLHNTGFYEWDLAAPLGVAKQYGLAISHWDQSDVVFNQMPPYVKNVFVAHPDLADDLAAVLEASA